MTTKRNDNSILKIEVTKKSIFVQALRPHRKIVLIVLVLFVLITILAIFFPQEDFRPYLYQIILSIIELLLGHIPASDYR